MPRTPQVTMPIDRDIRYLQNSFPAPLAVTKFAARSLHIRLSKLGVPEGAHYDVARMLCITRGTMTAQSPALYSLTELSREQYSDLMVLLLNVLGVEA